MIPLVMDSFVILMMSLKFAFVLTELPNLQSLSLEGTSVTDPSVIQFANSNSCPHLQHLDLSRTPVTHEIFMHLQSRFLT